MMTEFQLILQFRPWRARPIDDLFAIEDALIADDRLGGYVDGHDIGSNEANIFIITTDPRTVLQRCFATVNAAGVTPVFGAAYRALDDEVYVRLWPVGDVSEFSVR